MEDKNMSYSCSIVLKESETAGYDFNQGLDYPLLFKSFISTGLQASNLGEAIKVVNHMLHWRRLAHEKKVPIFRESVRCKVFLGFTSTLISSGVRDTIRYLVEHHMVDVLVITTGGIEEELIKCLTPTFKNVFSSPRAQLCPNGLTRIGNLLVPIPNNNYRKLEDWILPILDKMFEEQASEKILWTPSKLIARLGKELNDESSIIYWAYKNNIPVFCPGLADGLLGDIMYLHSLRVRSLVDNAHLIIDFRQDEIALDGEAVHAAPRKTGMIILGDGLPKHHMCNANMMQNGADYAVYINTAEAFDETDFGDEAVSCVKIRKSAKTAMVHCDATIAFPLLVAATFAAEKEKERERRREEDFLKEVAEVESLAFSLLLDPELKSENDIKKELIKNKIKKVFKKIRAASVKRFRPATNLDYF